MAILAALLGFVVGAIFLQSSGLSAFDAYSAMFLGAFSTPYRAAETLVKASPFMLGALGFALAFKAGYWNIGIDGQLIVGTVMALWGGITFTNLPPILLIPLLYLLGFLGAGAWSLISGFLKAKYRVNEILTTLMMNYVAYWLVHYLVYFPLKDPEVFLHQTIPIVSSADLPILAAGTRLHAGVLAGLASAIIIYVFLKRTSLGYSIRAVGLNPEGARYGGVNVFKTVVIASFLSGGIVGLGGVGEVLGAYHLIIENLTYNYGFIGIAASMLALNNPLGIILSSIFFGFLVTGSLYMTRGAGLTIGAVQLFVGIMILATLVSPLLTKVTERRKHEESV
jgi:simple sugar transport system permease protein